MGAVVIRTSTGSGSSSLEHGPFDCAVEIDVGLAAEQALDGLLRRRRQPTEQATRPVQGPLAPPHQFDELAMDVRPCPDLIRILEYSTGSDKQDLVPERLSQRAPQVGQPGRIHQVKLVVVGR